MATIGTVTYPTSTTWEVAVSGLAPSGNTFTVSSSAGEVTSVLIDDTSGDAVHAVAFGASQDASYVASLGGAGGFTASAAFGAQQNALYDAPLSGSLSYTATLGAAQDAGYADQAAQAFGATLGATSDASVMPPLATSWLARVVMSGLSWLAGPFQPFLLHPETALEAGASFGFGSDARVDYATYDGFGVVIAEVFDAAFGPAYLDGAAFPWTASAAFDASYSDAPPREADTDLWPRRFPVGLIADVFPVHLRATRHPAGLRASHGS